MPLRNRCGLALIALMCGCSRARDDGPDSLAPGRTTLATGACLDSVETRAIACSGHAVRRAGDTLYVRVREAHDTAFVNDRSPDNPNGFTYAGRIGHGALHVIKVWGDESYGEWIVVDGRTGGWRLLGGKPVPSPDLARFVTTLGRHWDECSELQAPPTLDVWRVTDTLPVREWHLTPWNCSGGVGWGPTDGRWRGPDTLEFVRNDRKRDASVSSSGRQAFQYHTRVQLAVRRPDGWHLVPNR